MAAGRSLRPAEALNEAAYQSGLQAMFDAVDDSFLPGQNEAPGESAASEGWDSPPTVRSARSPAGVRVVAASVFDLDDAAMAKIVQQAERVVAKAERHDRLAAGDR
ncbi:hypothetical protein [Kitasatospora sp. NPDC059327]|uniref:hypothetical protein n=1 Tax=Kitasatospora sp. NPDC059327 TaxID=3346803 RepID=UPI0036941E0F